MVEGCQYPLSLSPLLPSPLTLPPLPTPSPLLPSQRGGRTTYFGALGAESNKLVGYLQVRWVDEDKEGGMSIGGPHAAHLTMAAGAFLLGKACMGNGSDGPWRSVLFPTCVLDRQAATRPFV